MRLAKGFESVALEHSALELFFDQVNLVVGIVQSIGPFDEDGFVLRVRGIYLQFGKESGEIGIVLDLVVAERPPDYEHRGPGALALVAPTTVRNPLWWSTCFTLRPISQLNVSTKSTVVGFVSPAVWVAI